MMKPSTATHCCVAAAALLLIVSTSAVSVITDEDIDKIRTLHETINGGGGRQKRQLLFPIATLIQFSCCVASPIVLPEFTFFMNHGFQLNFGLPNRLSQIPNSFLGTPPIIDTARAAREKRAATPTDNDITSEILYHMIAALLDTYGLNGTGCILHSICELAKVPFHKDEDLLHEIVHFIMTPSEHISQMENDYEVQNNINSTSTIQYRDEIRYKKMNITPFDKYLEAELAGRSEKDCDLMYRHCPLSPLTYLSEVVIEND